MAPVQILFILVLYYNEDEVEAFFKSQLKKQSFQDYYVLIVNNGCDSPERVKKFFEGYSNVEIVGRGGNLGYFGAANFALQVYLDKFTGLPPFVIISNSDMKFVTNNFLELLIKENGSFEIAGPSIVSTITGSELNPFSGNEYSRTKLRFLHTIYSLYPFYLAYQLLSLIKRSINRKGGSVSVSEERQEVYAIHGSFMIFQRSYFNKGGHIKYGSFLYGEELFVAAIANRAGMRTVYLPYLRMIHDEHATTGTFKSRKQIRYMRNSIHYLLKTFYHGG